MAEKRRTTTEGPKRQTAPPAEDGHATASKAAAKLGFWERLQRIAAYFSGGLLALVLIAAAADRLAPPNLAPLARTSTFVVDKDGELLRAFTNRDGVWRLPATVAQVDPLYLRMLVAYEDQRFHRHWGIDPRAVGRALWSAVTTGRLVSGASTLTMQTARLLEPRRRTVPAKLAETARALQLESRLSKGQILAAYLTLAPFGGNIEGVRAASLVYFGKEPKRLTAAEAALLVILPQSPSATRPDRYPANAKRARDKVLRVMAARGVLNAQQLREALESPVPRRRHAMPFDAPHLTRALASDNKASGLGRSHWRFVRTTIDGALQRALQGLVRHAASALDPHATVAVLVVENATGRIRAYVGSSDFFDRRRAGQIDMVHAIRSPGSALKPVVYGMGFDDRIIHPETIIADVPTRFDDYQPENFRRVYHGEVTVREALQQSLNVPAVVVLNGVGPVRLASRLRQAGMQLHFDRSRPKPGLPLALGGVGITLHDLVGLYTGLANGGRVTPLIVRPDGAAAPSDSRRIVSEAAAWQLARILEGAPPPDDFVAAMNAKDARRIAYKTGTSYGFRDAWAVGYDAKYTIGVWVGRPDGTPNPGHYGRKTAGPILFRAFSLLPKADRPMPGRAPDGVLLADAGGLPPHLARYGKAAKKGGLLTATRPLTIAFPPDGAIVELKRSGPAKTYERLPLAAEGGRKPLKWLVNGRPIESRPHRREARWAPDGEGFVRITVIDADGRTASVVSRLR
jgi:penicillin-binding protein 1C